MLERNALWKQWTQKLCIVEKLNGQLMFVFNINVTTIDDDKGFDQFELLNVKSTNMITKKKRLQIFCFFFVRLNKRRISRSI